MCTFIHDPNKTAELLNKTKNQEKNSASPIIIPINNQELERICCFSSGWGSPKWSHNWLYLACTVIHDANKAAEVKNQAKNSDKFNPSHNKPHNWPGIRENLLLFVQLRRSHMAPKLVLLGVHVHAWPQESRWGVKSSKKLEKNFTPPVINPIINQELEKICCISSCCGGPKWSRPQFGSTWRVHIFMTPTKPLRC